MIKYIKYFLCLTLIALFSVTLFSCGEKEEVSVKSFFLTENAYKNGEQLTFAIEFTNKKNYIITHVFINSKKYSVICPDEDYNVVYVKDENLVFDANNTYYKLNGFLYIKSLTDANELSVSTSKICYSSEKNVQDSDIKMLSYTINNLNSNDANTYYVGDEVSLTINFDNPNKRKITSVIVSFLDEEMQELKEESLITVGKMNDANSVLNTTVELPSVKGDVSLRIKNIKYIDESLSTCNYAPPLTLMLSPIMLLQRPLFIRDFKLSIHPDDNSDLSKDVNGNYYVEQVSTVNVDFTIFYESMDELEIESFFINKIEYKLETYKQYVQKNNYRKEIYISRLPVSFIQGSIASEDGLKVYNLSITRVNFVSKDAYVPSSVIKMEDTIHVYDKIIQSENDLKNINVTAEKTVTGTYILGENINITNTTRISCLYNDVTFNGYLEGNGKALNVIDGTNIIAKPLFNKIGFKGVVQNLSLNSGTTKNTEILAHENDGIINNISIVQNNTIDNAEWLVTERTKLNNLININNGTISDVLLNGYIKFNSTDDLLILDFSVISNTNNGTIQNVINNLRYEFVGEHNLVNVYVVVMNNNGSVYSIVNTFGSNVDSDNQLSGLVKNTVFWLTPASKEENARYVNVYTNARLIANKDYVNVGEGFNIANMSCTPTEIGTEVSSDEPDNIITLFYSNLGFKTKEYGANNFWYLDAKKIPTLNF